MDIKRIQEELKQQDVFYTVEKGDKITELEQQLNYVPGTLEVANAARLARKGRTVHELRVGDELLFPQYTQRNHRDQLDKLHYQQVVDELNTSQTLRDKRTGTVFTDDRQWRSIRIYWSDWDPCQPFEDDPQGFNQTFPFAIVHSVGDAKALNQRVYLNRYENLYQVRTQEGRPFQTKHYNQAHAEDGLHDKTFADATKPYQESIKVPDDLMTDFCPTQKASCHPDSTESDPSSKTIKKYCAGRIASAVSQAVILRIELAQEVSCEDEIALLPNILTWAFLQPPTIGGNPYRVAANNGWVVDDAQKSGWFKAAIQGTCATYDDASGYFKAPMYVNRSQTTVDDATGQASTVTNIIEDTAWIKVDSNAPNIVYVKYRVEVRNDCSKEDFKRRRDKLVEGEKYAEVLSLECGSYLKVWARNLDFNWGGSDYEPQDHYNEDLRVAMEGLDERSADNAPAKDPTEPQTYSTVLGPTSIDREGVGMEGKLKDKDTLISSDLRNTLRGVRNPGYNPQLYRNHTWRRERLVDGEWITNEDGERVELPVNSAEKTRGDLLYVGLYPAELIDALNLPDQPKQPGQPRELNFPVWIGATIFAGIAAFCLGKLVGLMAERRANKAKRRNETTVKNQPDARPTDPAWWEKHYGEAVLKFIDTFKVKDLFAILAVDGLRENFDLDSAAERLSELYDRLENVVTTERLDKKAQQVNLNQPDSEILEDIKYLFPEAKQDAIDAFKHALKARSDTKKAFDELVESIKDDINIVSTYNATLDIYGHFFRYALLDPTNRYVKEAHDQAQSEHDSEALGHALDKEMSRQEGRPVAGMFRRLWGRADTLNASGLKEAVTELRKTLLDGLADDDVDLFEANTGDIDLIKLQDKQISPAPMGRPLPGWLAFLFWSRKVAVDGSLTLKASGRYGTAKERQSADGRALNDDTDNSYDGTIIEAGQTFADLLLELGSGGSGQDAVTLEVAFQLQAAWTAALQVYDDKKTPSRSSRELKGLNDVKWGPILKDVFDYLEVSMTVAAKLKMATNFAWQFGYLFEKADTQNPSGFYSQLNQLISNIDLECPISARLSVFAWSYHLAEAKLAEVRTEEASFLSDLKLFGEDYWDKGIAVSWGDSDFMDYLYRHHQNPTREVYIGDDIGVVLGYAKLEFAPDMTARFRYYNVASGPGQAEAGMVDILQLESKVFEYVEKTEQIDSYSDEIKNTIEGGGYTHLASAKTRFTLNQEAEELFGALESVKKEQQRFVDLSATGVKMQQLLNEIKNSSELELQCSVTPKAGDRTDRELRSNDTYLLKLPVIRAVSATRELGDKPYLEYTLHIENYKRDQEFAWVRLYDRDAWDSTGSIHFKARKDQKEYQEWNLMRLERKSSRSSETTHIYCVKIPLELLDTDSLKDQIGLWDSSSNSIELNIQLGYYAAIDGEDYPFKMDLLEESGEIEFPLDHPILQ